MDQRLQILARDAIAVDDVGQDAHDRVLRPARKAALHAIPHELEAVGAGPAGRRTLCASGPAQIDFIVDLTGEAVQSVDSAALGPGQSHEAPVEVGGLAAGGFLAILFVRAQRGGAATRHHMLPPAGAGGGDETPVLRWRQILDCCALDGLLSPDIPSPPSALYEG